MERKRLEEERPIRPQDEVENIPRGPGAGLAMNLLRKRRDLLKRYGLAVALAGLALLCAAFFRSRKAVASTSFRLPRWS